jgi:peptidoglycan-associated lipoprotein
MRKWMVGFFMFLCCGALVAGGCAKKELVKGEGDNSSATSTKSVESESAAQTPSKAPVKDEKVQEQTVKEASAMVKEESSSARQAELEKIYFDFDSFVLSAPSRATLSQNAAVLLNKNSLKVQIEGNSDERGSDEYNLALGEKRAKAAMKYLVTLGVPEERLSIISYGKEKPADPGHDEAAWAKNRRDEFILSK